MHDGRSMMPDNIVFSLKINKYCREEGAHDRSLVHPDDQREREREREREDKAVERFLNG